MMTVRIDRLQRTIDALINEVPDDKFDMSVVATVGFPGGECGSAACVMGWLPKIFPDDGWAYEPIDNRCTGVTFDEHLGSFDSAAAFFGISGRAAVYLFEPNHYPNPKQVAKADVIERMQEFIEGHKEQNQ